MEAKSGSKDLELGDGLLLQPRVLPVRWIPRLCMGVELGRSGLLLC